MGAFLAPLGIRITVWSFTPSRIRIITSRRSKSKSLVTGWKWAGVSLGRVALSFCCAGAGDCAETANIAPQIATFRNLTVALSCVALQIIQISPRRSGDMVPWQYLRIRVFGCARGNAPADYRRISTSCPVTAGSPVRRKRIHSGDGARGNGSTTSLATWAKGKFLAGERARIGTQLAGALRTLRAGIWRRCLLPLSACSDLPAYPSRLH